MTACHNSSSTFRKEGNGEDRNIAELARAPCALYVIRAEVCDSWVSMTDVDTDPCAVHSTPCALHSNGKNQKLAALVRVELTSETSLSRVWAYV